MRNSQDRTMNDLTSIDALSIQSKIYTIRGVQVMIDRDLAELYDVESKRLNEQVKRNINRLKKRSFYHDRY